MDGERMMISNPKREKRPGGAFAVVVVVVLLLSSCWLEMCGYTGESNILLLAR